MNTKVEPHFSERTTSVPKDISLDSEDSSIETFIDIVRKQAELNNQIITALSMKDLGKEEKMQMVQMLSGGAQNSSFFMQIIKDKEKDIALEVKDSLPNEEKIAAVEINQSIPPKGKIKDKFNKFKNMVISFKAQVDPTIAFRNPAQPDWYEVGYKIGMGFTNTSITTHLTLSSFFTQSAANLGLAAKKIKTVGNMLQSQFILVGEKASVKKMEKKFSKLFDLLGLEPKEILHSSESKPNLSEEELLKNISAKLNKELTATKGPSDDKFTFTILNGLTPELQLDMVQNLIWPKLNYAIKESMEVNQHLQKSKDDNKYLEMVADFAKENNFNPDLVIHSLKNNEELLKGYPKSEKILANKAAIIENADKYGKFVLNNFIYLESLLKASDDMQKTVASLNIANELKDGFVEKMNKTVVFTQNETPINFEQLKANVLSVTPEETQKSLHANKA